MKVGTDGVLLGAWCQSDECATALDIGTGTGLIALMLAQRNQSTKITAIEPNGDACIDAVSNIQHSDWADRIDLHQSALADFVPSHSFDLIVSNPPFFHTGLQTPSNGRNMARHVSSFDFNAFLACAKWLTPNGVLCGIYPTEIFEQMYSECKNYGLNLRRSCKVKPTPEKEPHRVLFEFGLGISETITREMLIIESDGRHQYSPEYQKLTRDFYLKF